MYYDVLVSNPMTKTSQLLTVDADTGDGAAEAAIAQCGGMGVRVHSVMGADQQRLRKLGLWSPTPNAPVAPLPVNLHDREPVRRDFAGDLVRESGGTPIGEEATLKELADARLAEENAALKARLEGQDAALAEMKAQVAALGRRGPGRPKKSEAA